MKFGGRICRTREALNLQKGVQCWLFRGKARMTEKEVVEQIMKLLKENGLTIRGYEGEASGCCIEKDGKNIAFIENETMAVDYTVRG